MSSWGERYNKLESLKERVLAVELAAGNPDALRSWYNAGAKGEIAWGTPGDLTRCHSIASKYMDSDLAWGFCQERHIDVTGEPNKPGD